MLKYFVNTSLFILLVVFACRSFSEPVLYEFSSTLTNENITSSVDTNPTSQPI